MRISTIKKVTKETKIHVKLNIDGRGESKIISEIGFLNHMLETLAKHGLFDIEAKLEGDIHVDQHHLVEDSGLVLGDAFKKALGNKGGISRMGFFICPMDDALAMVAVDLSGRPYLKYDAKFRGKKVGDLNIDLLQDFFQAFISAIGANLHIRLYYGRSDHHKVEAIFKSFAKALKEACTIERRLEDDIPSTKGKI